MTSLEQLQLRLQHVPHAQTETHSRARPSRLPLPPSFRKLECMVDQDVVPVTTFMSSIELPSGVEVRIRNASHYDDPSNCIAGISDFARIAHLAFKAARMSLDSPWSLLLTHYESYILLGDERLAYRLRLPDVLSRDGPSTNNTLIRMARPSEARLTISDLNGIFNLFPLARLQTLMLSGEMMDILFSFADDAPKYVRLINKLMNAPAIRHLALDLTTDAILLFNKLAEVRVQEDRTTTTARVFPFLETITISLDGRCCEDDPLLKDALAPAFIALGAAVDARRQCANLVHEICVDRRLKFMWPWEIMTETTIVTV